MKRYQQTKHVLGSDALLTIVVSDKQNADAIFSALWEHIQRFEARFSRFLPESELSHFNQVAGERQRVSKEFLELLVATKKMAALTDGLYNPFVLPALQRAGYKGSWPQPAVGDPHVNYEQRGAADWTEIVIGEAWAQIPEQSALDFGGIGKGYLLDELAAWLRKKEVSNFWMSLGGDILCSGYDVDGSAWQIAIQSAIADQTVANVTNDGKPLAVATSGVTKRKGVGASGAWHHIIDPRTGKPATTDILTATVCNEEATKADVFAKCLVIVGSEAAKQLAQSLEMRGAFIQVALPDGTTQTKKIGNIWN
ncbi:MAG TPA: FAD:protein FMN transferase [Candidatus Saccharimonadales bacterium]